jgi:hypothetical protein
MKWVNASVLDGGLNAIKTVATKMRLITAYTAGDSYATVLANSICVAAMASADFTLATSGSNRTLTTATKTANATANSNQQDAGVATGGSTTTLVNTAKAWAVNAFAGKAVTITTGLGVGQYGRIVSNTATVLTITADATGWPLAPDATSGYRITDDLHISFDDGAANVLWVTDETTNQPITFGNPIDFPAVVYTAVQPV